MNIEEILKNFFLLTEFFWSTLGEYVTLGAFEQQDIETVVTYLRSTNKISRVGLWGRSMGAVSCLFYAQKDPSIAGKKKAI